MNCEMSQPSIIQPKTLYFKQQTDLWSTT